MMQKFKVTIYNVQKWGFSPYSNLNEEFQQNFHFRAYVQLISNIRKSITRYVNDNNETLWTFKYRKLLKLQILLFIFCILLAIIGTCLLPYIYLKKLIGWTFIIFGITFCGIGLCICAIFWYHLKSKEYIKRYKYVICWNINQGLQRLNNLYADKAIFEITKSISNQSILKNTIDLDLQFQITLLMHNVRKQSAEKKKKINNHHDHQYKQCQKMMVKRKYISRDIFNQSRSTSQTSISAINIPISSSYFNTNNDGIEAGPKMGKVDSTQSETDKVLLLQMLNGETVLAHIIGPTRNENGNMDNIKIQDRFAFIELKEDSYYDGNKDEQDAESKFSSKPQQKQQSRHNKIEMYTKMKMNLDQDQSENKQKLELFHSDKVYKSIVNLVSIHNNDEYDGQYNYYNIGKHIGKYLDDIMNDKNCVIVVSETDKQPQLSYVAQKNYQRKIKNVLGKDLYIYRGLDYIPLNTDNQQYLTKDFKQIVLNLSQIYGSTSEIALELDNIYGGGCHVAKGRNVNYNIFCRYTHDLIARVELENGMFIIAWRR